MELRAKQGTFIGDKIKRLRLQLVMSQGQLARAAGIDQPKLSRIENGRTTSFDAEFLRRVAHALGVTVSHLLEDLNHPVPGVTGPLEDGADFLLTAYRRLSNDGKRRLMIFISFLQREEEGMRDQK